VTGPRCQEHPRTGQAPGSADEGAEQPELLAALAQRQPEVAVEHVQRRAVDVEVDAHAASRLAHAKAQVAPPGAEHWQPAQDHVAVDPGAVRARRAHDELRHLEPGRQIRGLIGVGNAVLTDHLLKADDVGVDLADDVGDPVEVTAAVQSHSAMDVVAHDGEVSHVASA